MLLNLNLNRAGVPAPHLPAANPAEFGVPRLGNRPRLHVTALLLALAGTAAARSARRGGHQQRAHSGRSAAQRPRVHQRVPRLPDDHRPVRPQNRSGPVALPLRHCRQPPPTLPALPGAQAARNRRLLPHYSAKYGAGDHQPPVRHHPAGCCAGELLLGSGQGSRSLSTSHRS